LFSSSRSSEDHQTKGVKMRQNFWKANNQKVWFVGELDACASTVKLTSWMRAFRYMLLNKKYLLAKSKFEIVCYLYNFQNWRSKFLFHTLLSTFTTTAHFTQKHHFIKNYYQANTDKKKIGTIHFPKNIRGHKNRKLLGTFQN
jgi:hypothetical protein